MYNLNNKFMSYKNKTQGHFFSHRPDVIYVQNPTGARGKRRYQTAIKPPDQNFFDMMFKRDAYFWICVKKQLQPESKLYKEMQTAYESIKKLSIFQKTPICTSVQQCIYWVKQFPCQIVMDQDIFDDAFQKLNKFQNAAQFHIVSPYNLQIAKKSRQNRRIKRIYDNYETILKIVKQNMQRLAIINNEKTNKNQKDQERSLRNAIFPNFIKLSKHDKAQLLQYRLNLYGLRSLTQQDKYASKDKFIEFSLQKFPHDSQLIDQYKHAPLNDKEILNFYTLDSFFYRTINNTLRIAKSTEQFFTIGEPFNKVFDAIKNQHTPKQLTVFRGADLTNSQCQYLKNNVGKYIQINGFISTSRNQETARQFAKDRNNNKVIQIHLKVVNQKFAKYDYGFVDLQQKHISAFDQQEILINALNIFKVSGKKQKNGFQYYVLEYGTIFQILQKDPNKLEQNDKYAYYSFRQLKQMNDQVNDIGQVYIRSHQPQKAVQIYQFKLAKLNQRTEISVFDQQKSSMTLKAADAYLANSQPEKALEYYQKLLKQTKNRKIIKRAFSNLVLPTIQTHQEDKQQAQVNLSVAQIKTSIDQYEQSEKQILTASQLVQKQIQKNFSLDLFMSNIQLLWENVLNKQKQDLYQQAHDLLQDIEKRLLTVTKQQKKVLTPFEKKKVLFKRTVIYEKMAKLSQLLEKKNSQISTIDVDFKQTYSELSDYIQKGSYEQSVLKIREVQIQRRNKNYDTQKGLRTIQKSLKVVKNNSIQTDVEITKTYNSIGDIKKKTASKSANIQAKYYYQKQLMLECVSYGEEDPRPANTKIDIANCQREDKNVYEALDIFHQAYHTKIYKKNDKHSVHAKILFNMAQAYTDKGDDGLAMKSYDQAYKILQKRLSKKDFKNSILRYKIILKIGRLYLNSSVKDLNKAQTNLSVFHQFIIKFYTYDHSDVALSYNNLGVLNLHKKVFTKAKLNFSKSVDIYQNTQGKLSLDAAKIKSNLALCYAQLKDQVKAIKILLQAQQIFVKIYTGRSNVNPYASQTKYCQGEINRITRQYDKAIQSYQQSILQEKLYRQNRKQFNKQFKSTYKMQGDVGSSIMVPQTSSYANFQNKESEHSFNCRFKISLCYLKMKKIPQAKTQLLQLKKSIANRIGLQARLGRDSLQSKKRVLLKKIDMILTQLGVRQQNLTTNNSIINKGPKRQNPKKENNQIKQESQDEQIIQQNLINQALQQQKSGQKLYDITQKMVKQLDD